MLHRELVKPKLVLEITRKLLDLSAGPQDSCTVSSERDMLLDVFGREGEGLASFRDSRDRLRRPGTLTRYANPDAVGLFQSLNAAVAGPSDEGIKLGRDATERRLRVRVTLIDNFKNLLPSRSGRDCVALDLNGDLRIIIFRIDWGLAWLGQVDPGASAFFNTLDGGALLANDVGAG